MRVAYLDCWSGISGNMLLGSLLDAGVPLEHIQAALQGLPQSSYNLQVQKVNVGGLAATQVEVEVEKASPRTLAQVLLLIGETHLPAQIKQKACSLFQRLFSAEARVHGQPLEALHLHEAAALDALVDVLGSLAGIDYLKVDQVVVSPLPLGLGTTSGSHGNLPVPAPATLELLKGFTVQGGPAPWEQVTPTGAALVAELCSQCGPLPSLQIQQVGYGAGTRRWARPNLLRLICGETEDKQAEETMVLETNLDDCNPQFLPHLMELLLQSGALDVFITPVQMKKNRPGQLLTVLCPRENLTPLTGLIFRESTTLGCRYYPVGRLRAQRWHQSVETPYGPVRVKFCLYNDPSLDSPVRRCSPEWEDCRSRALATGQPLQEVYQASLEQGRHLLEAGLCPKD